MILYENKKYGYHELQKETSYKLKSLVKYINTNLKKMMISL